MVNKRILSKRLPLFLLAGATVHKVDSCDEVGLFLGLGKRVSTHWRVVIHDFRGRRVGSNGDSQALHTQHLLAIGSFMV